MDLLVCHWWLLSTVIGTVLPLLWFLVHAFGAIYSRWRDVTH